MSLALGLTACAASPPSVSIDPKPVSQLVEAKPPSALLEPCQGPVDLRGYQGLSAGPVERLWFVDRESLVDCKTRKDALQTFYTGRDAGLAGAR